MELSPDAVRPSITRLKRAQGQLGAVIRMMEQGQECEDVVMQLAAVGKAIDRAGYTIIATGLKECLTDEHGRGELDTAKMEKLFLSLA
ncbi:MAG: metal-sensitive transcriptional regulator [Ornithinimicrobium sp.]|jgi:DNA-binding FrmR family transcriptional regulator|uniref:metal-sensitive transcriptional regulator n=1 Tax=Ornithinimicrobium sp. TaxID=1977084 RepID=UPI003D9B5BBA